MKLRAFVMTVNFATRFAMTKKFTNGAKPEEIAVQMAPRPEPATCCDQAMKSHPLRPAAWWAIAVRADPKRLPPVKKSAGLLTLFCARYPM